MDRGGLRTGRSRSQPGWSGVVKRDGEPFSHNYYRIIYFYTVNLSWRYQ